MRSTAAGVGLLLAGTAVLLVPAAPDGTTAQAIAWGGLLALAAGLLVAGLWRRRAGLCDLAFVAAIAAVAVRAPALADARDHALALAGGSLALLGCAVLAQALPRRPVPLRSMLLQGGATLLAAAGLAAALLLLPGATASWVSPRWAASIDAGSVPLLALLGLAFLAVVAGTSLLATRPRAAPADPASEPLPASRPE